MESNIQSVSNENGSSFYENSQKVDITSDDYDDDEEEDNSKDSNDEQVNFCKELKDAFDEFYDDQLGGIPKEEFGNFVRKLGHNPTLVELQEMTDVILKDKQSKISFEELKSILSNVTRDNYTLSSSVEAFEVFDKGKKGKINKNELKDILATKGDKNLSETEINDLLDHYIEFDENGDLNYKSFVQQTFDFLNSKQ